MLYKAFKLARKGYVTMTYNEAMKIAMQSCDGTMDDLNRIARGLMCEVDTLTECDTSEEEKWQKEHGKGWYKYY